jgi:hypothetical protein
VPRIWVSALEGSGLDVLREYIARAAAGEGDFGAGARHDNIAAGDEVSSPPPDAPTPRSLQA